MFYSNSRLTVQTFSTSRKNAIFRFLFVLVCLVFTQSEGLDWEEGLDNSVRDGTAWIISDSVSQPDKYFQIQSHQSQKCLTASSNLESKAQILEKKNVNADNQIWTVHSTLGFPFRNGSFAPLFEISSSPSLEKTNYIINSLRMWRLELVQIKGELDETFIIYRPFNNSCVVETENSQDETHKYWSIELEDCESTTKNKLWTFLPVPPPTRLQNDYLGLEHRRIETDFDTNSIEN